MRPGIGPMPCMSFMCSCICCICSHISLINVIMLPQFILSGTIFSAKRFPDFMQPLIQALPLTQINAGLREVMLEGAGIAEVWWRVAILAAYAVAGFVTALRVFRWV